ncbi:TonB-dependent receptor [soil metagenome]
MRASYEARLQSLERRLQAAESLQAAPLPLSLAPSSAVASGTAPAPVPVMPAPAAAAGGANGFNPAISLILSGGYQRTSRDPANYRITGIQLPKDSDAGPGSRGFSLAETELGLAASIDPWLRGAANISLHPDNTVSVEEAFVQTTGLDHGLSLKAGRFYSGIGYLNSQHSHTWDFVDNPLAYQAYLGTQFNDDGVQLSWLAPTDQYIELGAELGRGKAYPGSDTSRNGAGMSAVTAHTGGDIGISQNWRVGLSMLNAKADAQALVGLNTAGNSTVNAFTGSTRVWIADAVWKWAPNGNATRTNFKLQGEYLRSQRTGSLTYDLAGANTAGDYRAAQSGWYVQAIYQFVPSWRVGLRTERLSPGSPDYGMNAASFTSADYHPRKNSLMVDFSPSEFSRFRLQLAQDRSRQGPADNQIFLQYQMSLGAHGAHSY